MTAKAPAVMIESASKWYGEVIGLNDVSLAIDGGVTGVLGPNGAGNQHCSNYFLVDSSQAKDQ